MTDKVYKDNYDLNGSLLRSKKVFQLTTKENICESTIEEVLGKYEIYDVDIQLIEEEPIDYSDIEVAQTIRVPIPVRFVSLMSNDTAYDKEVDKYFSVKPRFGRVSFDLNGVDYGIDTSLYFTKSEDRGIFYFNLSKRVKEGHFYIYDSAEIKKWDSDKPSCFFIIDGKKIVVELYEEYNSRWDDE